MSESKDRPPPARVAAVAGDGVALPVPFPERELEPGEGVIPVARFEPMSEPDIGEAFIAQPDIPVRIPPAQTAIVAGDGLPPPNWLTEGAIQFKKLPFVGNERMLVEVPGDTTQYWV